MGFFSFLLRRHSSNNDLAKGFDGLKAQSYETTVAAKPPIFGAFPAPGNRTNLVERLQQIKPHVNNAAAVFDSSAPPPIIPRFRSDSVERPKTAPSRQVYGGISQAKSTKRQGPPYKLSPKIWSTPSAESKSSLTPPLPAFPQERTSSILSSSSRGFVDLLDAQSAIRPADFRSRIKATGARDYGEDVADRNIGENGLDLTSAEAREFYMKTFSTIPFSIYDTVEGDQPQQPRKRHSIATGFRAESITFPSHGAYPKKGSSHVFEQHAPSDHALGTSVQKNRRNSLHSYVALSSSLPRPRSSSKSRNLHESDTRRFSRMQQKTENAYETSSDIATKASSSPKPTRSLRNNSNSAKHPNTPNSRLGSHHRHNEFEQSTTSLEENPEPVKCASKRQTMHHVSNSTSVKPLSKRHSLHAIQSHNCEDHSQDRNSPRTTPLSVSKSMEGIRPRRNLGTPHPLHASPLPKSYQGPSGRRTISNHRDSINELVHRARAKSIASISSKDVRPSDIEDIVPERNSSLRNHSLTSETTTYSSLGSNPFRPQSRHTPNTSVDLTPTMPFFTFTNPSQNTLISMVHSSPQKDQSTYSTVVPSSVKYNTATHEQESQPRFDIDDHESSDDSFENPHKPRGENERELLFVESGYGLNGSQLPGLPGIFSRATSHPTTSQPAQMRRIKAIHSSTSSISGESEGESYPDFTPYSGQPLEHGRLFKPRGFQESASSHKSPARTDESIQDSYSSEDEINFDIPRSRTSTMRYNPTPSRLRYETKDYPLDEKDDEDDVIDFAALMRLRRDMKMKRREFGYAVRKIRSVTKLNAINVPVDDQSGYMTDVEG